MKKFLAVAILLFAAVGCLFASSIGQIQQDVANAIINGGPSANTAFNTVRTNIDNLINASTETASIRLGYLSAEAMAPSALPILYINTFDSINGVFDSIASHCTNINLNSNVSVWGAGSVGSTDFKYDNRELDKTLSAVKFGADISLLKNLMIGLGYSYDKSDIDLKIADLSYNEMQAGNSLGIPYANPISKDIQVSANMPFIYGRYDDSGFNVSLSMGYLIQDYQERGNITGESLKSDYSVDSLGVRLLAGYDIQISTSNAFLTPEIGFDYINLKQNDFQDSIGNKVSAYSRDNLRGLLGLKLKIKFIEKKVSIIPSVRFGIGYDIFNNHDQQKVTLANGSNVSLDTVDIAAFDFNIGAEVAFIISERFIISLSGKAMSRQDYQSSLGSINVGYKLNN